MNTRPSRTRRSLAALAAAGVLSLATAVPATAVNLPDPLGDGISRGGDFPPTPVNDNSVELIQVGLGALGGIALAGAGAAALRSRRQHHPQLA